MRKIILILTCILCFNNLFAENPDITYQIIPLPSEINLETAAGFVLSEKTKIIFPAKNEEMNRNACFLAQYIQLATGVDLPLAKGTKGDKSIRLSLGLQSPNPEAYRIHINAENVVIQGASEAGVFYGIQTLRKSIPTNSPMPLELPAVAINDEPRFGWRGMHLDVSRHFFTIEEVKRYIDILALHNCNTFHWHLSDDQGWRIEIKKYPRLTEIGSKRPETVIGKNTGKYDGIPHSGFYTQDQIKEVVAYAKDRYINIVPEIDLPGHMLAALAAYPELGCTGGPYSIWRMWGVSDQVLCVGNDKTLTFIKDIFQEIIKLFPYKYIHIGGDECPKTNWAKCQKCQTRIQTLGLQADDKHSAEERLQSWLISNVEQFLNEKNRKIIGWDEILEGGLAPNATVMSWRGVQGGIEAARQKHDVIMTPNEVMYFDHYQTKDIHQEPLSIGGFTPVSDVYEWEPVPTELTKDEAIHILGAQANVWTEYIATFKHVEYMVLPRLAALCEVQWTNPSKKDYNNFLTRIPPLINQYKLYGYNYAKHLFDIQAEFSSDTRNGSLNIRLNTTDNAPIRYTLDGTTPTKSSPICENPIKINKNANIQALAFRGDETSRLFSEQTTFCKSSLKTITGQQPTHKQYTHLGFSTLVDCLKGNANFRTDRWIGFYNNDLDVVIDLTNTTEIREVSINTCISKGEWVLDARNLKLEISEDGESFTPVSTVEFPAMKANDADGIRTHKLKFDPIKIRYIRVIAGSEKTMPEWHSGAGNPAFLFVDEITVN